MKYTKVESTDFYHPIHYQRLSARLHQIQPDAQRHWGDMTVSQMLHHLNVAIGSGLGYYTLPDVSNFVSRNLHPFLILRVLRQFPMGTRTAAPLEVTGEFDFETEKRTLKEILDKAYHTTSDQDWGRHTYFGPMSRRAWGRLIMIHCHHHFQQFGY